MKIIYRDGTTAECPKEEELDVLRHSAAHIMAQAIKRLYPHADFGYGPSTEKGFFYDVDLGDTKLTDEDLKKIENEMKKIVKENLPIKPFILPRNEAIALMEERGCKYKVEHIGDLGEAVCSLLSEKCPTIVKRIGVNDEYGHSGPAVELLKQFGLSADHIVEVAKELCK